MEGSADVDLGQSRTSSCTLLGPKILCQAMQKVRIQSLDLSLSNASFSCAASQPFAKAAKGRAGPNQLVDQGKTGKLSNV